MSSPPQQVPPKFNTEYIYIQCTCIYIWLYIYIYIYTYIYNVYPQTPLGAAKINFKSTSCVCGYIINNENQDASVCDYVVYVLSSGNQF